MDIIFLDTSIFEKYNFLEGERINEILKLSEEGVIKIVMPQLTYDEILSRVKKNIEDADLKFDKYRRDTRILRNIPALKEKFEKFDVEKAKEDLIKIISDRFKKAKIIIIDYPDINIKEIFDGYFKRTFPFSKGKKNEFPDAFALKILEIWCKKNKLKVKVFSYDNDINKHTNNCFETNENFENYLDLKLREVAEKKKLLLQIENAINEFDRNIISDVKEWVYNELDDVYNYYDYLNFLEVHDVDIKEIDIDLVDYQITSVDDEYITLQFKTYVNFKVDLTIDDENFMIKDYETKDWIYLDTTTETVDDIRYINVDVIFYIEDNEIIDYEVETINNGQKLII